jgi:hypothetical protein
MSRQRLKAAVVAGDLATVQRLCEEVGVSAHVQDYETQETLLFDACRLGW